MDDPRDYDSRDEHRAPTRDRGGRGGSDRDDERDDEWSRPAAFSRDRDDQARDLGLDSCSRKGNQLRHLPRIERQLDDALTLDDGVTPTVLVSTTGAVPVTETCSDTVPIPITELITALVPTCRTTAWVKVLKADSVASTRHARVEGSARNTSRSRLRL